MKKASSSKKTKKVKIAKLNKKPLLVLVAVLFIAIGLAALIQTYAAQTYLTVCNSGNSKFYIKMYNINNKTDFKILAPGGACGKMYNADNRVRVDVDAWNWGTDAYQLKRIGGSYGDCHRSANYASDPPNDAPDGIRYVTYAWPNTC